MVETYIDKLRESAKKTRTIACVGLDPDLDKIPLTRGEAEGIITTFYEKIIFEMINRGIKPAAVKPNYAFYAQYGHSGLSALSNVIGISTQLNVPIILDFKRGDIGNTSKAYAKEGFEFWGADAVTVAPFMGSDSVGPFIEWCDQGKGVYILNRTSNKGREDLQDLPIFEGMFPTGSYMTQNLPDAPRTIPLYLKLAEKIALEWHKPGIGAVVGATSPDELEKLSAFYVESGKIVPMLIPGVGKQGGSASEVMVRLIKTCNDPLIHRINSSSEINYAWQKENNPQDYAGAAVRALDKLNKEIIASGLESYL